MSCVAGAYTNGSGAFDMHGTHSPITLHMQGWRRGRVSREAEAPRPVQEPAHADSVRRGSSSKRLQVRLQHQSVTCGSIGRITRGCSRAPSETSLRAE